MATNGLQMKINNENAYPYVCEKISNSNGTALKYADGTMICYGKKTITTSNNQQVGNVWYTGTIQLGEFPVAFVDVPTCSLTTANGALNPIERGNLTGSNLGYCWLWNPTARTNVTIVIDYIAIGRWY